VQYLYKSVEVYSLQKLSQLMLLTDGQKKHFLVEQMDFLENQITKPLKNQMNQQENIPNVLL
jgi:nitrate reductase NapAB chaperone NapD